MMERREARGEKGAVNIIAGRGGVKICTQKPLRTGIAMVLIQTVDTVTSVRREGGTMREEQLSIATQNISVSPQCSLSKRLVTVPPR